jgi:hypothetical protein
MPFSPFMGLSTIVHVVIIVVHTTVGRFVAFGANRQITSRQSFFSHAISVLVLVAVIAFVNWSVFNIVTKSFESDYSTLHIAESYSNHTRTHTLRDYTVVLPMEVVTYSLEYMSIFFNSYRTVILDPAQELWQQMWIGLVSLVQEPTIERTLNHISISNDHHPQ